MRRVVVSAISAASCVMMIPNPALAVDYDMSQEYAAAQCSWPGWWNLGYPSYQECHDYAVYYYYTQVPGGRGTFLGDVPGYMGGGGCGSRLCGDT